nr:zinc finger protein 106 isoform X2 [Scatophagus argus]
MAMVQTPHEKAGPTSAKKKKKKKKRKKRSNSNNCANNALSYQRVRRNYCVLCRRKYLRCEALQHMDGLLHHRELETVLGKNSFHECQSCKESCMGLNEYAQHISSAQHKANLKNLMSKNVKPISLSKSVGRETMSQIQERNKMLRMKKETKKKKKKLKQLAGLNCAEMQQGSSSKDTGMSQVVKLDRSKKVTARTQNQVQGTYKEGSSNAVVQNKENKVTSLQRLPHTVLGHLYFQDQFNHSAHQRHGDNVLFNSQCSIESSRTDISYFRRPHNTRAGLPMVPQHLQITWPAVIPQDHDNKLSACRQQATDFTSDHLPQNGAIIFDHSPSESTGSSRPGQQGSYYSSPPVSASRSSNAAPIQDIDVSLMLRQIRRALGVREPCRADREARKQNSEEAIRLADKAGAKKDQPAGGSFTNCAKEAPVRITSAANTSEQSSLVSSHAPVSSSGVHRSSIASAKPRHTAVKVTQGATQRCEKSSVVARVSSGPSNSRERESHGTLNSQTSLSRFPDRTASSEPNLNITRKVRIAHEPAWLMNKLLDSSGTKSKLNWKEMYKEVKKKKLERMTGMPRFGIELATPLSHQKSSTRAEDLPLSEGFHWESFPDSPLAAKCTEVPPQPQDTTLNERHTKTQEPVEHRGAAHKACSDQKVETITVKVEPDLMDGNGDFKEHSGTKKRKQETIVIHEDISHTEPKAKKKKTKSNKGQDQMDQLLAVSLREEELSHSLQDLENSMIQARNTLQAVYAEVQRLLLLRQQCTTEINSLRTKRIEILQGMQGGYSGEPDVTERASTSSAGAAAAAATQPTHSSLPSSTAFPTSSSHQQPPTNSAFSISQPHPTPHALPTMSLEREVSQPSTVSCNPKAPEVPVNQPVPLFPSNLLPSLLFISPSLANPTSLKQPPTQATTSASTFSESPAKQEQVTREVLKDCVKTVSSVKEEANTDWAGGNLRPAAEKPASILVHEKDQKASATAIDHDREYESDDSVKVIEPSSPVVIDIDESDDEETITDVCREAPQKSVNVEVSTASAQALRRNDVERPPRKSEATLVLEKDASVPPEYVDVVKDEELSLGAFENHAGPVHGLQIHEGLLYTCSGDNTARAYCLRSRACRAVFTGHTNKINCLLVSSLPDMPARLFTGSSDETVRCYSTKSQRCLDQISLSDRVLCMHVAWNVLFVGLANGSVGSYDLKTLKELDVFECHGPRGVSCLGVAQEGARRVLLVGSYDNTISVRDAKSGLLLRSLEGHTRTVLCMQVVNDLVFSGSSDMSVRVHNIHTGELVRMYKGHSHAVTSIVILGKVMITACLDKLVRVYKLQSHDCLQVYGGHSDMVMCMAVHKSVIYTGCYDGSIQAVKLNLMKNYRCWWQNCSLIFSMAEHLIQHLVKDHASWNHDTVRCRWRGCSTFFANQQLVRQELLEHMQSHVESDSKVQPWFSLVLCILYGGKSQMRHSSCY